EYGPIGSIDNGHGEGENEDAKDEKAPGRALRFEIDLRAPLGGELSGLTGEKEDLPAGMGDEEFPRFLEALAAAWGETFARLLRRLPESAAFRRIASGRVYLFARRGDGLFLAATALDPSKPWQPWRPVVGRREKKTIEELLSDFDA